MQESIQTAVRMVGFLLEHHGGFGPMAQDEMGHSVSSNDSRAAKWCAMGACRVVSIRLDLNPHTLMSISDSIALDCGAGNNAKLWEDGTPEQRAAFIKAHKEYVCE